MCKKYCTRCLWDKSVSDMDPVFKEFVFQKKMINYKTQNARQKENGTIGEVKTKRCVQSREKVPSTRVNKGWEVGLS